MGRNLPGTDMKISKEKPEDEDGTFIIYQRLDMLSR